MVGVAIIGAGQTKYGNHDLGLKGMWAEAARNALSSIDQNFDAKLIEEAYIGSTAFGGGQLGNTAALLTEHSGMDSSRINRRRSSLCEKLSLAAPFWFSSETATKRCGLY